MSYTNVHYTGAGTRFLMVWWSENEQHKVVLAKSVKALDSVVKHFYAEDCDSKIVSVHEVELVAPSKRMTDAANALARAATVHNFCVEVSLSAQTAVEQVCLC